MATIHFGPDFEREAHEVKSYVTVESMKHFLIRYEDRVNPSEWSVCDAECMERIAHEIREFYKQPRMSPEEEKEYGLL